MTARVETTHRTITYREIDRDTLEADVYAPAGGPPAPILICAHGGGWKGGLRRSYRYIGPFLAAHGYVVLAIDYRLVQGGKNRYPAAVDDVRTALAYAREHAADLNGDASRIALMGDSAGGHLAALIALTQPQDVRALVGIFGVYDLAAQWQFDLAERPHDNITAAFLGTSLVDDRRLYFDASPLSYATTANNAVAVLLAWGTHDDIVSPKQSERFLRALKQAGFYVRTVVQHAPHYWLGDPLDEPGSHSAVFTARLLRFLEERLRP